MRKHRLTWRERFHNWVVRMRLKYGNGTNHEGVQEDDESALAPVLPEFATPLSESLMVKPWTRDTGPLDLLTVTEPARTWDEIADQQPDEYDGGFTKYWTAIENRQLQAKLYGLQYDPEVPWEDARDATPVELDESEPEPRRKARKAATS